MKRFNLKLAISIVVGTLVMVAGVWIVLGMQQKGTSATLKQEAEKLVQDGKKEEAMKNYRARLEISERTAQDDPKNASARLDLGDSYAFVGIAAAELGDTDQGLAMLQKAIDLLENEATRDPKLSFARRVLGLACLFRGQVLLKAGKLDGALSDFKKTAAIYEAIASVNANDIDAQIEVAAINSKIADVLAMRGESGSAAALYQKSLAIVEPFAHTVHPLLQAQYAAADAGRGLGVALQKQATRSGSSMAEQADSLKQACSWFQQSAAEWQRVSNPGKFSPTGFDTGGPSRVAQELSSCEAHLKNLKERTEVARH